jgi:hypothetical protein
VVAPVLLVTVIRPPAWLLSVPLPTKLMALKASVAEIRPELVTLPS